MKSSQPQDLGPVVYGISKPIAASFAIAGFLFGVLAWAEWFITPKLIIDKGGPVPYIAAVPIVFFLLLGTIIGLIGTIISWKSLNWILASASVAVSSSILIWWVFHI